MNKKRIILFSAISIILVSTTLIGYFLLTRPPQITQYEKSESLKNNVKRSKNPAFKQIRKTLNSYLNGDLSGTSNPKLLINGDPKLDQENFLKTGLKNFSKDYYKSKFIVLKTMSGSGKRKIVFLEFIDKQDKVFVADIFQTSEGNYELAYFGQNLQVAPDMLYKINSQYSFLLKDKSHAL